MKNVYVHILAGLFLVVSISCATPEPMPIASEDTRYEEISIKRFKTGAYAKELYGQFVKVEGLFYTILPGDIPEPYADNYIGFTIVPPDYPEYVATVACYLPKDSTYADLLFSLKRGDPIVVYGNAQGPKDKTVAGIVVTEKATEELEIVVYKMGRR